MPSRAEVIAGPRDPSAMPNPMEPRPNVTHAAMEGLQSVLIKTSAIVGEKRPGERIYHSRISGLRVQLTSPADRIDQFGRVTPSRPIFAQFREGVFRVHPKDPRFNESDLTFDDFISRLESNPNFGLGRDFWDAEQWAAEAEESQINNIVEQATADPGLRDRLLERLMALPDKQDWPSKVEEEGGKVDTAPAKPPTAAKK